MISDSLITAAAALIGLMVCAAAALRGWQGWLALKARELDLHAGPPANAGSASGSSASGHAGSGGWVSEGSASGMARIEIADLKERIRKLEAIAAGVDL